MKYLFSFLSIIYCYSVFSQQPPYTDKLFKKTIDTSIYKVIIPKGNGLERTYIFANAQIWDLSDDGSTYVRSGIKHAFLIIDGNIKNGKRDGLFSFYLLDSLRPEKRYKIWEQTFFNDKLNGIWNTYTINGKLCRFETFRNDSLNGITREIWIDGKTILNEVEYFNGRNNFIKREYYPDGKVKSEIPYKNLLLEGQGKNFYENGHVEEIANFNDNDFDGDWKYFYDNGQLWIHKIFKKGKEWQVISNFTKDGVKRNVGTLQNGNGNIIYYNENGTVREVLEYKNGVEIK